MAPGWDRWVVLADGKINVDGEIRGRAADSREVTSSRASASSLHSPPSGFWAVVCGVRPTSPHFPITPSRKRRHEFDEVRWKPPAFNEADMSDKPSWLRDLPMLDRRRVRRELEGKLEELQDLDDQIGKTLAVLTETGQLRRTWIFFVSDNGFLLGEHRSSATPASSIPTRSRQASRSSRAVPGVSPAVRDALVSQVDLMPTALDIAGLDPDAGRDLDGRSMLGPLTSGDWSRWRQRLLVENTNLGWAMLREGSIAYIEHERNREREFYNLERDPHQLTSRRDADVRRFAERLDRLRQSSGTTLRAFEE